MQHCNSYGHGHVLIMIYARSPLLRFIVDSLGCVCVLAWAPGRGQTPVNSSYGWSDDVVQQLRAELNHSNARIAAMDDELALLKAAVITSKKYLIACYCPCRT